MHCSNPLRSSVLHLLTIFILSCTPLWAMADASRPLPTVTTIDLDRYAGRWFEISRLPMWFERNCIGDVTATYTRQPDNRLDVVNRCRSQDAFISARGIAEVPDPAHPGQLRVRFAPDWLAWIPAVWGDYWIIDLDPDYRWVMIGAPSRGYLWILARTPILDQAITNRLKQKAADLGFDTIPMINVTNATE